MAALVISVRLHDGRYHGEGDWPPCPARLFQAFVAGAGISGPLSAFDIDALCWLERLPPPVIAGPRAWRPGLRVRFYVPNNDGDSIQGDPARIAKIRTEKIFQPYFFDPSIPFLFAWTIESTPESRQKADAICSLALRLYQFGRGVDMAWASGDILEDHSLVELLAAFPGEVYRPSENNTGFSVRVPCPGSLHSLLRRHKASRHRFRYRRDGRTVVVTFHQPPKARFRLTRYNSTAVSQIYELHAPAPGNDLLPWPLERTSELATCARDAAVRKLTAAMPSRAADIKRVLVGRKPDGSNDYPPDKRVRIIPLPSIGHFHADRQVRRILVEVPPSCLLSPEDIHWAFSGLDLIDADTCSVLATLVRSDNTGFLRHFGIGGGSSYRLWRTVTPCALPAPPKRGPQRSAQARLARLGHSALSLNHALRQAGVRAKPEAIRLQREPFDAHGKCAQDFSAHSRFDPSRLWHVELHLSEPLSGPLIIGDGRFLGLGLLVPVMEAPSIHVLKITDGLAPAADWESLSRSLRRAVIARAQHVSGQTPPPFISGHAPNGAAASSPEHPHIAFVADLRQNRLLIIAPHEFQHRAPSTQETGDLRLLAQSLQGFDILRAGSSGLLRLSQHLIDPASDPLTRPSAVWRSLTPYLATRHYRAGDAVEAIRLDLRQQLLAHNLPEPNVSVEKWWSTPGRGLEAIVKLQFRLAVSGPILVGRNRFLGGGVFTAE